jgi:cellulase
MKFSTVLPIAALAATEVAAHATFQQLWVNGVDQGSSCVRLPNSNSPVESVSSANLVCNANRGPAASKCGVRAGDTVTIEIHQQNGDRSCSSPAIGGAHYGPITAYLSKTADSASSDPAAGGWFKIFQNGWSKVYLLNLSTMINID